MSKKERTASLKKIRYSGYSGSLSTQTKRETLLDFHILDNGTVFYNTYIRSLDISRTNEDEIPDFEKKFGIDLSQFINS